MSPSHSQRHGLIDAVGRSSARNPALELGQTFSASIQLVRRFVVYAQPDIDILYKITLYKYS